MGSYQCSEEPPAVGPALTHDATGLPASPRLCRARWLLEKTAVSHLMCVGVRRQQAHQSGFRLGSTTICSAPQSSETCLSIIRWLILIRHGGEVFPKAEFLACAPPFLRNSRAVTALALLLFDISKRLRHCRRCAALCQTPLSLTRWLLL